MGTMFASEKESNPSELSTVDRESPAFRIAQSMNVLRQELGIPPSDKQYRDDFLLSEPMADLITDLTRYLEEARHENEELRKMLSLCRGPNATLFHMTRNRPVNSLGRIIK